MIPLYLVNLPRSSDRLEAFRAAAPDFTDIKLVRAVDGRIPEDTREFVHLIPPKIAEAQNQPPKKVIKPGVFGCFCSHYKVWHHFLQSGATHALVMEDDAKIVGNEQDFSAAFAEAERQDLDILMTNRKSRLWLSNMNPTQKTVSLDAAVRSYAPYETLPEDPSSIGTDGYIISQKGARKLIQLTNQHRIRIDVDIFMVLLSVNFEESMGKWPHFNHGRYLGIIGQRSALDTHILSQQITTNIGGELGRSTIQNEERVSWDDLK